MVDYYIEEEVTIWKGIGKLLLITIFPIIVLFSFIIMLGSSGTEFVSWFLLTLINFTVLWEESFRNTFVGIKYNVSLPEFAITSIYLLAVVLLGITGSWYWWLLVGVVAGIVYLEVKSFINK